MVYIAMTGYYNRNAPIDKPIVDLRNSGGQPLYPRGFFSGAWEGLKSAGLGVSSLATSSIDVLFTAKDASWFGLVWRNLKGSFFDIAQNHLDLRQGQLRGSKIKIGKEHLPLW
ncbi:MAG: hypothetical protein NC826_04980 [Candidatus Omnitrophica bacterium]|nr:hypothetical protein [Candidatus Omnitrophota bacterium]